MAWTQADIDQLKTSIKRGVRSCSFGNRSVTFHSLEEMERLLGLMEREVNASTRRTFRVAVVDKMGPAGPE